jgi:hypothetical protein
LNTATLSFTTEGEIKIFLGKGKQRDSVTSTTVLKELAKYKCLSGEEIMREGIYRKASAGWDMP